jgi:hypothetical protein
MTVLAVVILSAALLVLAMYRMARGHAAEIRSLDELKDAAIPIDLTAFENLISDEDEQFLRNSLSKGAFARVMRKRNLAVIAYLEIFAANAAVLIRLAEHAAENSSENNTPSATAISNQAMNLRLHCLYAIWLLRLQLLIPRGMRNVGSMVPAYRNLVSSTAAWAGNYVRGSEATVFQTLQA